MNGPLMAAVRFRGKVYVSDYHADCMQDAIEDTCWPESHQELERIIDNGAEPFEFGRVWPKRGFVPLPLEDQQVRREYY